MNSKKFQLFFRSLLSILLLVSFFSPHFAHSQSLKQLLLSPGDLTSPHKKLEDQCEKCHLDFSKSRQTELCLDCHDKIAADISDHSGYHGLDKKVKGAECKICHSDHKGRDYDIVNLDTDNFNHHSTNFLLDGKHSSTACTLCHTASNDKKFRIDEKSCFDCHEKKDEHKGKLGKTCEDCHTTNSWKKQQFDHSKTDYSLMFKHQEVACNRCHINRQYKDIGMQCNDCHRLHDTHQGRFGNQCKDCHSEKGWQHKLFDHNIDTKFELRFSHKKVHCLSCHQEPINKDKKLPDNCFSCHKNSDIHNGRNGEDCQQCHTAKRWSKSSFNHNEDTEYVLTGRHKNLPCNTCHNPSKSDEKLSQQCNDCHQRSDPHQQSLGKSCENCHSPEDWKKTFFSHELTKFPLIGMHRQLSCQECHLTAHYEETPSACHRCHKEQDTHKGALGKECNLCHNPNDWTMWIFNHDKQTHFPLEGAHTDLQCELCHSKSKQTSQSCAGCHRDDDIHRGSFGKRCNQCHQQDSFELDKGKP